MQVETTGEEGGRDNGGIAGGTTVEVVKAVKVMFIYTNAIFMQQSICILSSVGE